MKLYNGIKKATAKVMPPTRGHDLKLPALRGFLKMQGCPPHGGTT